LGVAIFFVLSGMLLSIPFWSAYFDGGRFPGLPGYAARRLVRIIPAYYACLIILFAIQAFVLPPLSLSDLIRLLSGLSFTNSFHWRTYFPTALSPPCWSIGVEMVFYVLLPVWAAGLFLVRGRAWPVLYTAVSMIAIAILQWALLDWWPSCAVSPGEVVDVCQRQAAEWLPAYNPFGLFAHFLFGCVAGGLVARHVPARRNVAAPPSRSPLALNRYDWLAILLAFLLAADLGLDGAIRTPSRDGLAKLLECRTVSWIPYRWPVFPALISALLVALCKSRRLGNHADNPFCVLTATLSFGIYLWHVPVIFAMNRWCWPRLGEASVTSQMGFIMVVVLLSYALAGLSYIVIERPVRSLVQHRTAAVR
jgi:peptidoglycan/LPS O-acetylase OafA/YrhL